MTGQILVVDDVPLTLQLLERKLGDEFFEVLTASDGQQALDIAARQRPDLILLDVMMPGMDGFEVCQRLKADPELAHIPVVMMTGLDSAADRERGLDVGADDFLIKPIYDLELYARVRSLLRLKQSLEELRSRAVTDLLVDAGHLHAPRGEPLDFRAALVTRDAANGSELAETLGTIGQVDVFASADPLLSKPPTQCDIVVIDLTSNVRDGLRQIARLRASPSTRMIPVLAVVLQTDLQPLAKAFELGAGDCLKRPVDRSELKARVRTLLMRRRITEHLRRNVHLSMQMATTDAVTGLYNRHYMASHITTLTERARQSGKPFSLAMLDLDHFKKINDRYGHGAGDQILKGFASRLSRNVRGIDLAARYGGEEFVVLMPDTDLGTARNIAQRLVKVTAAEQFAIAEGEEISVTVSAGVAMLDLQDSCAADLLKRADNALYQAKSRGRNLAVVDKRRTQAA